MKKGKPLPCVWLAALAIGGIYVVVFFIDRGLIGWLAGWPLLGISVFGVLLALTASVDEEGNRAQVWGELGRSLVVAGLLAFTVWMIDDLRRPVEERSALQVTLGLQQEMPGVDLHEKDLSGFDLAERNLKGANLEGAQLDGALLAGTNLIGANLVGADLSGANIEKANLTGADLSYADMEEVEATLTKLREARLLSADLSGAELSGADMRGICLAGGSLAGASLPNARLEDAALTETDLQGARFWFDLRPAELNDVGLAGAEHTDEASWPPAFAGRVQGLTEVDDGHSPAVAAAPPEKARTARVLAVPDGDTVLLATSTGRLRVRMSSINAPDLGDAGGGDARDALRRFLPEDSRVSFTYDKRRADDFGRQLLYLFNGEGELINQLMVQVGAVIARPDSESESGLRNDRYEQHLEVAESWARRHALGIWAECPP
ncbi:MAG TPA: pentapeptide repeat-containing protein [Solirubrobacterales bacterium]